MEIIEKILEKRWYYHSLIWLLATFIILIFLASENTSIIEKTIDTSTIVVPSFVLTYLLFFYQDFFFATKRYALLGIISILTTISMGYAAAYFSAHLYGEGAVVDTRQWIQNMLIVAFIVIVSRFAKRGIISQLALRQLQVDKLKMEIHLLKAQLNPHFLFNTINNICGVNQVDPEKSTEMLINLAELLRYHLEFSAAQRIPISKEVQLIASFIELEKIRLRNNCTVVFEYPQTDINTSIAPLLLLPFVENAFKHGVHSFLDSFIDIKLTYDETQIDLIVENSLFEHQRVVRHNIGQQNTIKRLQLIYPDRHNLLIEKREHTHFVHLNIRL